MTDLLTQAEEFLRKNGQPLLADAVHEVAVRADSLTLEVQAVVEMAQGVAEHTRALLGDDQPGNQPR